MGLLTQALRVARLRMASGLTGSELVASLQDVFQQLEPREVRRLQQRIAREEFFLGQAAHDPNLYRNCHEARQAKKESPNQAFMILTYKTPVCSSCGYNRRGTCGLMGGILLDTPETAPEAAVHRTGDILSTEGELDGKTASRVASVQVAPILRLKVLHKKRLARVEPNIDARDTQAKIGARRIAAILESGDPVTVKAKNIKGPAARKAANTEGFQIGAPDSASDRTASKRTSGYQNILSSSPMLVRANPLPGKQTSAAPEIDSYSTSMSLPREQRKASRDVEEDNAMQAQNALYLIALKASRILAKGIMTADLATRISGRMEIMEQHGATHTGRTAAIRRQLAAMSGCSLEL